MYWLPVVVGRVARNVWGTVGVILLLDGRPSAAVVAAWRTTDSLVRFRPG